MNNPIKAKAHTFHIPVMGIGYTIDTPIKLAHLGIDAAISLVDDILLERLRKMYSEKYDLPYSEIEQSITDHRAKRITAYLDMVDYLSNKNFEDLKHHNSEDGKTILDYINLLPENSSIKQSFEKLMNEGKSHEEIISHISPLLQKGSIDVNIMTKIDKDNYQQGVQLPKQYNDAHAALRGYALSTLESTLVLSAGMNPSLYSYLEEFEDFYPDDNFHIKKKIALKVSDFKSALIQGKFLAKKGIWVSEYRVESGLNCGGHAFATNGLLMGPILNEFKNRREELIESVHEILIDSLKRKNRAVPQESLTVKLSVQGGVGLTEEHHFLLNHYGFDSIGWGSPFLLVPEATAVDKSTLKQLQHAGEDQLYLSNISPLGVPFNSMKGNTKDVDKDRAAANGKAGSKCPKKYVALNYEFTKRGVCTASRLYQLSKLKQLEKENLPEDQRIEKYNKIVEKSCICVGLGTSALIKYNMDTRVEGEGVSVCPGPNMAYFSEEASIDQMLDHIYGRAQLKIGSGRPHMFLKELKLYFDHLQNRIKETELPITKKQQKQFFGFTSNLAKGIDYYLHLFSDTTVNWGSDQQGIIKSLKNFQKTIPLLNNKIESLELIEAVPV